MSPEEATIGTRVRSNREFAGVPKGSLGIIVEDYGSGVMVEWQYEQTEQILHYRPLRDGFSKDYDLQFLDKI